MIVFLAKHGQQNISAFLMVSKSPKGIPFGTKSRWAIEQELQKSENFTDTTVLENFSRKTFTVKNPPY